MVVVLAGPVPVATRAGNPIAISCLC